MKLNSFQSKRKHFHQNSYVNMMKKKKDDNVIRTKGIETNNN